MKKISEWDESINLKLKVYSSEIIDLKTYIIEQILIILSKNKWFVLDDFLAKNVEDYTDKEVEWIAWFFMTNNPIQKKYLTICDSLKSKNFCSWNKWTINNSLDYALSINNLKIRFWENKLIEIFERFIYIKIIKKEVNNNRMFRKLIKNQNWDIYWWEFYISKWIWLSFIVLNGTNYCHIFPPKNKTWL